MYDLCHRDGGPLLQGLVSIQSLFQYMEGFIYWDLCKKTDNIKTDKLVSLGNVDLLYSVDEIG